MPLYEYVAKDQQGKTLKGVAEAQGRAEILEKLGSQRLVVISLKETKKKAKAKMQLFASKVVIDDLVVFSRELATMVDAGMPILVCMDVLAKHTQKKSFQQVLTNIRDDIEVGTSLSSAFAKHPDVFAALYISMVKAGESSGMLDEILDRLATYLEKTASLQKKIKSALIYPIVVTVMATAIFILMLVKVIPVFRDIYSGFNTALPTPTQILINVSDTFKKYFPIIIGAAVVIGYLFRRYISTDKGRFKFDSVLLRLPVFGALIAKVAVSKFTRTLSTLVKSGVPILASLEVVGRTCGNKVFERAIESARLGVREGENIAMPLEKSAIFPPMVVKMIEVGEQTGQLEKMLSKISDFYDQEVDAAVSGLTSLIEPLIIAFLGVTIGGVVICMFLPIFKLSTIISV